MSLREKRAILAVALALCTALCAALFIAWPGGGASGAAVFSSRIFWQIRVPEAATAFLVGGVLGLSGLLFQLVLRNPLADPYVLGVAGGSTFGAVAVILLAGSAAAWIGLPLRGAAAFGVGLATLFFLLRLAGGRAESVLLGGVIVNTAFAAGARILTVWLSPEQLSYVTAFLIGFIPTPPLWEPLLLLPPCVYVLVRFMARGRGLDLLLFSDDEARSLGLDVSSVRREALFLATLLSAAAVTLAGMIGFVGLLVPHGARWLAGHRHRALVPLSFLMGAAFLLGAQALAKVMASSFLLPVGTYTSMVGVPAFLALLIKRARGRRS